MPQVTILLGKGGTGRTTLSRAIALNSAQRTSTALIHANPNTTIPPDHVNNLTTRTLDPPAILEDAITSLIPLGPLTRTILAHPAYESLIEIAPGLKEAAVLNHLYGFLQRRDDAVILDGPATGHGLHFLEAPSKLANIVTGKIRQRLERIDAFLKDPERTNVLLVALPEELPAQETAELAHKLTQQGFPLEGLIVNRMPPPVPYETNPPPDDQGTPPTKKQATDGITPDEALALMKAQREEADRWCQRLESLDLDTRIVPSLPGRSNLHQEAAHFVEGFP